jgi:type II secretion system protein J
MTLARTRHDRRGFTLLELVLAMAFVAMLSMTLYGAMRAAFRARSSATSATESIRAASIVAALVRQDLESVPPIGTLAAEFIGTHAQGNGLTGDNDYVEFYSIGSDNPKDDSPLAEGIRRIELLVRTDTGSPALVRRVTRNLLTATQEHYEDEILCRNVRSFSLRYFDGTTWQESWDSTALGDVVPMAVVVVIELNDPARPDAEPKRVSCVVPLACGKPTDATTMGGL